MTIRVVIADDHEAIRSGLVMIVDGRPDLECVGTADTGYAAIAQVDALAPDVVLMDIRMPGLDGIAATRDIVARTGTTVLVLTSFDLDDYVLGALRAGASGFLLKTASAEEIARAIRAVAVGDAVLDPKVARTVVARATAAPEPTPSAHAGADALTARERDVLQCLGEGLSNVAIARRLTIGETTVKTHVSRVLAKLGLTSRVQAAIVAREILGPPTSDPTGR